MAFIAVLVLRRTHWRRLRFRKIKNKEVDGHVRPYEVPYPHSTNSTFSQWLSHYPESRRSTVFSRYQLSHIADAQSVDTNRQQLATKGNHPYAWETSRISTPVPQVAESSLDPQRSPTPVSMHSHEGLAYGVEPLSPFPRMPPPKYEPSSSR